MKLGNWTLASHFPKGQGFVLLGLANGMTNKEIAKERGVSPGTIKATLEQIRDKWGSGKRSQLVAIAIEKGVLKSHTPLGLMAFFIGSIVFSCLGDLDIRRTSNRLSNRTTASRQLQRGRKDELASFGLVDFEFEDMTPRSLRSFLELQKDEITLAPCVWSVAHTGHSSFSDFSFGNTQREIQWRQRKAELNAAISDSVLVA